MQYIGRKLLQSVGFASPDDHSIKAAIEANDAFSERRALRDRKGAGAAQARPQCRCFHGAAGGGNTLL
jgi:hypothetical protein